jgi:hypothetical protein
LFLPIAVITAAHLRYLCPSLTFFRERFFAEASALGKKGSKTVRVTAAVYEGFTPLNRSLTHSHWAGLRKYTSPFGLALPYVFVKQSGPPCHCDLLVLAWLEQ